MTETNKVSRKCVLQNELGLHARPATLFVRAAMQYRSEITVHRKGGNTVDGKSILGLLMLAAGHGTTLVIEAVGDDAQEATDALENLIASKFGEH